MSLPDFMSLLEENKKKAFEIHTFVKISAPAPIPGLALGRRKGSTAATHATTSKQACDQCVQGSLPCDGGCPCGDKYVGVVRAGEGLIPALCFMRSCIMFLRDASREALGTSPASREAGVGFFLVSGAFWIFRGHTCHRSDPSPAADFCVGSRRAFALLGLFAVPVTGTAVISTGVQRANPSRRRPVAR
ncbi:hypothetical protein B0H13DRAFT_2300081 [Mycena leptocephala]|nr:hypothetical protein B0H13DRAFT_2300081 [Mycena leptocephala]